MELVEEGAALDERSVEVPERWATLVSGWRLGMNAERGSVRNEELLALWGTRGKTGIRGRGGCQPA